MREQLKVIEDLKNKATTKEEVALLNDKKAALEIEIALREGISALELSGLDTKKQSLDFINKELEKQREIVKEKQKAYDKAVSKHGKDSPEAIAAQKKLNEARSDELKLLDAKKEKLAAVGRAIQSSADQLKSLLASFGMDGKSAEGRKINTLLDLASGAGEALAGVAMKNPAAIISGAVKAVSSLFKTHVVSDTKLYEENVRSLADAFSVLSSQMENLRGEDKFKNYDEQIKNQTEQIEERKKP